jgi:hypothetical protein
MSGDQIKTVGAAELAGRPLRYFDFVMAAFVTILLLSNVIGAGKVAVIDLPGVGLWPFGAGILFFPVSYVIGDVLTEVYGFGRARRCIWAGFAAMLFMAFMATVVVALPPAASWTGQAAYEQVFGQVPRIVFASILAFWAGEFVNSYVLAKMKLWTAGRHLWMRTIGSTIVGEAVDGVWDSTEWFPMSGANAAGDMVSTPRDVVTFLNALFDGRILGPKQLSEMKDNLKPAQFPGSKVVANGHGLLVMRYGDIDVKGHLGQIPGHTSLMGRDEKTGVTAMLIQNSGAADFESFYLAGVHEPFGEIFHAARAALK